MRHLSFVAARLVGIFALLAIMAGCSVQLAPDYQQTLVDGLNAANTTTLTLFAAVSTGAPASTFATYKPRYDGVIGAFDALRVQASSRPIPPLAAKFAAMGALKNICTSGTDATACVNSTADKLQNIVDVLTEMRRVHSATGLSAGRVALLKTEYEESILDALTIEAALKR